MVGETISHYHVLKLLGKGAMGEVYLAKDTRLKRHVALKVLAGGLRQDQESFRRFKIEAEAVARLNHPNIATLYTVEEIDDRQIIAMEYIDGVALKEAIPETGLDLDTFLDWFSALAEALAHAHERNVIHRDIKPGNIIITRDNIPKILDFGLARIHREGEENKGADECDACLTQIGTIMGSPAYMSPEQASGAKVDSRTDIFSLGIVMYEALTGERPFKGQSIQEIITSILKDDPANVSLRKPVVPPLLEHVVSKALQKNLRKRYQTAQDIVNDLRVIKLNQTVRGKAVESSAVRFNGLLATPSVNKGKFRFQLPMIAALLVAVAVLGWQVFRGEKREAIEQPYRFFSIPLEGISSSITGGGPSLSPDGRIIAYVQEERLWLMNLATGQRFKVQDAINVEGQPFWSPDSRYVCYFNNMGRTIMKMAVAGAQSMTLCDVSALGYVGSGTWGKQGEIVFDLWGEDWTRGRGLLKVSQDGGAATVFMPPDLEKGETYQAPFFLPDDRGLLYVTVHSNGQSELMVKTGQKALSVLKNIEGRIFYPTYCDSGYLLYQVGLADHYGIWAVPFSMEQLAATGSPFLVAENGTWPSVAADHTLTYMAEPPFQQQLVWLARNGQVLSTVGPAMIGTQVGAVTLSADQTQVAMDGFDTKDEEIWIIDISRGTRTRLTYSPARDADATWSPDGQKLIFSSERDGVSNLFLQNADPGAAITRLLQKGAARFNPHWSMSGRFLAYEQISEKTKRDLWYLPLNTETTSAAPRPAGDPVLFLQTPFDETMPQISPDSRYIAFMSNISGRWEVYARPFPEGGGEWQVSIRGGKYPRWSDRGDELFFVEEDSLMSAKVHLKPVLKFDIPVKLFEWKHLGLYFTRRYHPRSDGMQFLAVQETSQQKRSLNIVQHWNKGYTAK